MSAFTEKQIAYLRGQRLGWTERSFGRQAMKFGGGTDAPWAEPCG